MPSTEHPFAGDKSLRDAAERDGMEVMVGMNAAPQRGIERIRMDAAMGEGGKRRFDGTSFPRSSEARGDFPTEFDRSASRIYFQPSGTLGFGMIASSQARKKTDSKLDALREKSKNANNAVHSTPYSVTLRASRSARHEVRRFRS